jgi:hypothetical protein
VAGAARDPQGRPGRQGLQQPVDPLVGGQSADEQDPVPVGPGLGGEPAGVGPAVDDLGPLRRGAEQAGREPGHGQVAVEQPVDQPAPGPPEQAVVGDGRPRPHQPRRDRGHPGG